jgi:3-oxoacyl-(acyl-carrier-protein) synthase III
MWRVEIMGAGHFVPDRIVTNDEICRMVPGWPPDKLEAKTGIQERRFLWEMDMQSGYPIEPTGEGAIRSGVDMSQIALERALKMAGIEASDLDALLLVTCTPDEINFGSDAMHLVDRMGIRRDARILQFDSGCGGALYYLNEACAPVESGRSRNVALIAHNLTSALVDRDMYTKYVLDEDGRKLFAYLSPYIFGDGAGALVLGPCTDPDRGFVSSWGQHRLVEYMRREGGGGLKPPHSPRTRKVDHAFIIDGKLVAKEFPIFMEKAIKGVLDGHEHLFPQIERFYLHQANMRLVEGFAKAARLPMDRVPMHMDRYGNTSAAGTLILFAEDLEAGNVSLGSGQLVLFAAIGAGAHYGAHLIRL